MTVEEVNSGRRLLVDIMTVKVDFDGWWFVRNVLNLCNGICENKITMAESHRGSVVDAPVCVADEILSWNFVLHSQQKSATFFIRVDD